MLKRFSIVAILFVLAVPVRAAEGIVHLATSTSTANSGLLTVLRPAFEKSSGLGLTVTAVGTGRALRLGRQGAVDVVLVHAPEAENRFVFDGYGIDRRPVMFNYFVIVGPTDDPAGLRGARDIREAMARIADSGAGFVSRGDDSGTHKRENRLWNDASIEPYGNTWYLELGVGMARALKSASDKGFYTLSDMGTWLAHAPDLELALLFEGGELLYNPYHVIAVNPERNANVNHEGAGVLVDWLVSEEAQNLIDAFRIDGTELFRPRWDMN